jgi:hypothetical protein
MARSLKGSQRAEGLIPDKREMAKKLEQELLG